MNVDPATGEVLDASPKPFSQFLVEQRQGGLHSELSEKLSELVAAVAEHGKPGSLTLQISVKPIKESLDQYLVIDDVKIKAPSGERAASLFFADSRGNLSRSDPRQPQLPLREVPAPETTAREVGA